MAKRVSRRELKEQIRELRSDLKYEKSLVDEWMTSHDKLKKRLDDMGSRIETFEARGGGIETIEIKPEAWGTYVMANGLAEIPDEEMEQIKIKITNQIARGLIESSNVQFIVNRSDLNPYITVGAKVYVVPWDKLAKSVIKLHTIV